MKIDHNSAILLEEVVCRAHSCERGGMAGYISAAQFRDNPMKAAELAFAPLWKKADSAELEEFMYSWSQEFRFADNDGVDVNRYVNELSNFVDKLIV